MLYILNGFPFFSKLFTMSSQSLYDLLFIFSGIRYRLAGNNVSTRYFAYGRAEISIGGQWGSVCDAYFDQAEAAVFCRSIGYSDGEVRLSMTQ